MEPETMRWLDYATADFGVAKHLLATYHPKPLEITHRRSLSCLR